MSLDDWVWWQFDMLQMQFGRIHTVSPSLEWLKDASVFSFSNKLVYFTVRVNSNHADQSEVAAYMVSDSAAHMLVVRSCPVWVKIPPGLLWHFFPKCWEFFHQSLRACYTFLSTVDYKFLFSYLQLWRSYAILSVTTQFTSCAQNVHHRPKRMLAFSDTFPKQLGIFSPNFTWLLHIHIYTRIHIFIQLSPTVTKLCHIKCDHPACVSGKGRHFEHMKVKVVTMNVA